MQVLEVAERAGEEEVLADAAEGAAPDFSRRLRPAGPAGARLEAVVPGEAEPGPVADRRPAGILAGHGRLHAIVEDRARHAAEIGKGGGDMAAQEGWEVPSPVF